MKNPLHVLALPAVNQYEVQPGELAIGIVETSEESFELLVVRYEPQVARTAYRLLGRTHEAQDATQEVLLRLFRNLRKLPTDVNLPAWLYRVTVNVCRDAMKRRPPFDGLDRNQAVAGPDPERALAFEERKGLVADALSRLTQQERECITLHDIEGLSTREVSAIVGCGEATVRSHLSSGSARLKEIVQRRRL